MSRHRRLLLAMGFACAVQACSSSENVGASGAGGLDAGNDVNEAGSDSSSGGASGVGGSVDASDSAAAGASGSFGSGGLGGTGGASTFDCSPAVGSPPPLKLTQVVNGISAPVVAESPTGDTERLFIGGVAGTIRILKGTQLTPAMFLDITNRVKSGGEQGLLGLAFHPGYADNGRFFVYYTANGVTAPTGYAVISEFARSASDPEIADPTSEKVIFTLNDPFANHNGGAMHFRDGLLFIGLGDGGSGGDPLDNGQTLSTLLGKILRIDVDNPGGGLKYGIPAGNMTGPGVRGEIWSHGLRNPWRWSFDACTEDMYIADVGQNAWEEIDFEPKAKGSGTNYGWRVMEGNHCFNPATNCDQSGKTLPIAEYSHATNGCSVTGGYVYRGSKIPGLRGWYIYADYCTGHFWLLRYSTGTPEVQEITSSINPGATLNSIASFGQDGNGELYVLAHGGGSRVFRIEAQ